MCKLELVEPITHMLMENLSQAELWSFIFFPNYAMLLFIFWSANGLGSALTSNGGSKVNCLNDDTF